MTTERDLLRVAIEVQRMVTSYVGAKSRNPYASDAKIPWTRLDRLADTMRAAGIDPYAPNLGHDIRREIVRKHERSKANESERWHLATRHAVSGHKMAGAIRRGLTLEAYHEAEHERLGEAAHVTEKAVAL